MKEAFQTIHKDVRSNLFSMNGDVAKLIMDKPTTTALGGVVTIDHYVKEPEQLIKDIDLVVKQSGGRVVLGEFGAPIPDIHGNMNEEDQAAWMKKTLGLLAQNPSVVGVSYWVGTGGSTQLWDSKGNPRQAVGVLTKYYHPDVVYGTVRDESGAFLEGVTVRYGNDKDMKTDMEGRFWRVFTPVAPEKIVFSLAGYQTKEITDISDNEKQLDIVLESEHKSRWQRIQDWIRRSL